MVPAQQVHRNNHGLHLPLQVQARLSRSRKAPRVRRDSVRVR